MGLHFKVVFDTNNAFFEDQLDLTMTSPLSYLLLFLALIFLLKLLSDYFWHLVGIACVCCWYFPDLRQQVCWYLQKVCWYLLECLKEAGEGNLEAFRT